MLKEVQNFSEQIRNTAAGVISGERIFVSEEIATSRFSICQSCDQFLLESNRCKMCGCFMKYKTKVNLAKCPAGKW
jgi:hypothetical protein